VSFDFKGNLNPSKTKSTKSCVRNVRIDFRTIFPIWYKKSVRFVFCTYFASEFSVRSRAHCESSRRRCQKIVGCWESAVYGFRPLIASKSDSSPPERPSLDNTTSHPCSEVTYPCITSSSVHIRFFTIFLFEKTRRSTRSGSTGASCVRPWLTRDIVWIVPEGMSQVSWRSEVGNTKERSLNTLLSSGTSTGTFTVSADPYRNYHAKASTKNDPWNVFGTVSKKGLENRSSCFEPKNLCLSFSRASGPPSMFFTPLAEVSL